MIQIFRLRCGRSIAPQLGGPDDPIVFIEDDEPVLLTTHADRADFVFAGPNLRDAIAHRFVRGIELGLRRLLEMPVGKPRYHFVRSAGFRQDLAGADLEYDRLRAAGSAVDAER